MGYKRFSWCWISSTLATRCKGLTHWKRPWCWERLKAGGGGDYRGCEGWMALLTKWTWIWACFRSWWWTGKPGVLQSIGSAARTLVCWMVIPCIHSVWEYSGFVVDWCALKHLLLKKKKDFHKCWSGPLAKRRLCLGPAGVINCTPLSTLSFWVSLFCYRHAYQNGYIRIDTVWRQGWLVSSLPRGGSYPSTVVPTGAKHRVQSPLERWPCTISTDRPEMESRPYEFLFSFPGHVAITIPFVLCVVSYFFHAKC